MAQTNLSQALPAGRAGLPNRARRYAAIINLLFARVGLAGSLKTASRGARHLSLGIRLNDATELNKAIGLAEPLALASAVPAIMAGREDGLVVYQFQLNPGFWESYTRADLPFPLAIGLAERRRAVCLGFDPPHSLVAGTTGSGKSETIRSAIAGLTTAYSPAELNLILIDPHRELTDFSNLAHLAAPVACTYDDIRAALRYANGELARRKENDLKTEKRLVVVIDEATDPASLGDKKSGFNEDNLAVIRQIANARKYRIHLILGTQKPSLTDLPGILDLLLNRFVGQVADARLSAALTGRAGLQAHKLTGKGDFLHVAGPDDERFQVAQAARADIEKLERVVDVPVPVVIPDLIEMPPDPDPKPGGGRPPLKVDPAIAAGYFWRNPASISIPMARELFGLSRDGHNLHREFVTDFITELHRLRLTAGRK